MYSILLYTTLYYSILLYTAIIYLLFYIEKARQAYSADHLLAELKESKVKAEAAAEKRHKENLEIRQRLLTSFENLVDVLKNK